MKKLLQKIYYRIFNNDEVELEKSLEGCRSLLDIGCGSNSPIKSFSKKFYCVGVDAFLPSIEKSKKQGIHDKYYNINVLDIGEKFEPNSFDCVLASDLIEHLTKEEGIDLLNMMERIAKNKIVIFTPNGFLSQGEYENNRWQIHKSGWTAQEMEKRGYRVIGINGWKPLRGEYAELRFCPKLFWLLISDITQIFVRNRPAMAFQILCVKTKEMD